MSDPTPTPAPAPLEVRGEYVKPDPFAHLADAGYLRDTQNIDAATGEPRRVTDADPRHEVLL